VKRERKAFNLKARQQNESGDEEWGKRAEMVVRDESVYFDWHRLLPLFVFGCHEDGNEVPLWQLSHQAVWYYAGSIHADIGQKAGLNGREIFGMRLFSSIPMHQ
jgi:hypothetical protein